MSEIVRNSNGYVGYEHKEITASRGMESLYADGYPCFGWTCEGTDGLLPISRVGMRFKRDRKINNKAELTRLQRQFENCASEIEGLERSKTSVGMIVALIIGVIGTAFLAGATFCFLADFIVAMILLAIPGFAGWIVPYFAYLGIRKARTAKVAPLIEQKYDEIDEVCTKASALQRA